MRLIIKNGKIITASDIFYGDILIEDGVVKEIGTGIKSVCDSLIDAKGMIVIPGGVDIHTHFNLHAGNFIACDDFYTGTVAAACGGTTCIVDHMGFGPEGCSLHHQLNAYHGFAEENAVIDYGFHGVVQHVDDGVIQEMESMITDEGIPSFKIYLTYDYRVSDLDAFLIMKRLKELGGITAVHCENNDLISFLREKFVEEGNTSPEFHALSRPEECENEAVYRMINIARAAGNAPLYIVHLTTGEALDSIYRAQKDGQKVFAETCPQYLLLDEDRYKLPGREGLKFIMSPPLRKRENQDALWGGIGRGVIQVVATDHCPFPFEGDKQRGRDDFTKCPNGAPGVEERIPLMFSEGVMKGRISINKFVEVCCTNPAKIMGLYPAKGTIAPGSDGDITIIDPEKEVILAQSMLHSRCDYTAYEGFKIKGCPVYTISRGEVIYKNGEFTGIKGRGRFVKRQAGFKPQKAYIY